MTPDVHTNREFMFDVGDGHQLYVQDWGHTEALKPVLYLHGGPGGGTSDSKKTRFDPERQRVIFFDQRGSGNSLPYGSLAHNTTDDLVNDIVLLLDHLELETVVLSGGSWGSSLALIFAIRHPERVSGLVIDGVWTCTKDENDWLDGGGLQRFFPDAWQRYQQLTPAEHRNDPSRYHFTRALGDDVEAAKQSAYAYESLEGAVMALDDRRQDAGDYESYNPAATRIEIHYLSNHCFIPENYILDNTAKLTMPIYMIQGRYDMVCPPVTAFKLSRALPNAELYFVVGGHYSEHESWGTIRQCLLRLTEARK